MIHEIDSTLVCRAPCEIAFEFLTSYEKRLCNLGLVESRGVDYFCLLARHYM